MPSELVRYGDFVLHSGQRSSYTIHCDSLTDAELGAIARLAVDLLPPFGSVEGVPTGGLRLARLLEPSATEGPPLIVDDVLTTGRSMEEARGDRGDALGFVIFARGPCPSWVRPLFLVALAPGSDRERRVGDEREIATLVAESRARERVIRVLERRLRTAKADHERLRDRNQYLEGLENVREFQGWADAVARLSGELEEARMELARVRHG